MATPTLPQYDAFLPTESWWLDAEHFYERARAEQPRMRLSRYGDTDVLMTGVDYVSEKPRKTARAKEVA